jgi:hypothetical protein
MRLLPIVLSIMFSSCGIFTTIKRDKFIESKGFDPQKDTSIIKPYQYYIKHKGYVPIYRELNPTNKLDEKINIKGFENSDSIPIEKLFDEITIVLGDTSLTVEYGELYFSRSGYGSTLRFGKHLPDSCLCKASFSHFKSKQRNKRKGDVLFFWNVSIIKDGVTYAIPARFYNVK